MNGFVALKGILGTFSSSTAILAVIVPACVCAELSAYKVQSDALPNSQFFPGARMSNTSRKGRRSRKKGMELFLTKWNYQARTLILHIRHNWI
jgi:hypothetical protein